MWEGRRDSGELLEELASTPPPAFTPIETFRNAGGHVYHGDNLDCMVHLLHHGSKFHFIYADPPFFVGKEFHHKLSLPLPGGGTVDIKSSAYEDFWNRDEGTYLAMIHPRLLLMRELLTDNGVMCLHIDGRMNAPLRLLLDEIFGRKNFVNEIIWMYGQGGTSRRRFPEKHDTLLIYSKGNRWTFNRDAARLPFTPHAQDKRGVNYGGAMGVDEEGRRYTEKWGTGRKKKYRYYLDQGKACPDVWTDIPSIQSAAKERSGYPTQKPTALLERLLSVFTNPADSVADFFAGSGTTAFVASQMNRHWTLSDASPLAIHHARNRLLTHGMAYKLHQPTNIPPPPVAGKYTILAGNVLEVTEYTPEQSVLDQIKAPSNSPLDHRLLVESLTVTTHPGQILAHWTRTTSDEIPRLTLPETTSSSPQIIATDTTGRRTRLTGVLD